MAAEGGPGRTLTKKASKEDVQSLAWLHVDIDPRAGDDLSEEQERIRALLAENQPKGVPEPTCVIFSGGGYQAFWRLEVPFPIDGDLERAAEAERYNKQLEILFSADSCHLALQLAFVSHQKVDEASSAVHALHG